jgi:anti-anti-sigma regulatory factor
MLKAFVDYAVELKENGNTLMLSGVSKEIMKQLDRTDTDEIIGKKNIFPETEILIESVEQAWQEAQKRMKHKNKK